MSDRQPSPYLGLPDTSWWKRAVSGRPPEAIDPHIPSDLAIGPTDKVASAGSCFAQRISQALQSAGYGYLVTEAGPPFLSGDQRLQEGYGVYSARYGNVYSSLQLLQLFQRAFETFHPCEPVWGGPDGSFVDPFRPAAQPGGFSSEQECLWDRTAHLAAVRQMFMELDVFIFTLGLTETWLCAADGAALPVCPGSGVGGSFDAQRYKRHNFNVSEVVQHMSEFIELLAKVNPGARLILTVSPVPLIATFEPRHVLQATTYSKSVLRVASEELVRRFSNVHYFASYEIVTASGDSKSYFHEDRRSVAEPAVDHVIQCFKQQFMRETPAHIREQAAHPPAASAPLCDEDLILKALAEKQAEGHR